MIAACLAFSVSVAVAASPDTLPFELRRSGGVERLSDDPARPVEPTGFAFDAFGRIYVSDAALRRMVRFAADGRWLGDTGALGDDAGGLRRPTAVATAGVLQMAVLDEENRRIVTYDLTGHVQGSGVDLDAALDGRSASTARPVGLASDQSGRFYVADADGDRIIVLGGTGELMREIGGPGESGPALRGVAGVAVARRGDIVVSERVPGRIVRLDPTGARRASWLLPDSTTAERLPIAVNDSLRVACADPAHARVWVFDGAGRPLARLDKVEAVSALAFARDGSLWVAERSSRRLERYVLAPRTRPRQP